MKKETGYHGDTNKYCWLIVVIIRKKQGHMKALQEKYLH